MPTIDKKEKVIKISADGLVRVDGIGVFRRVVREGVVYIQFRDNDRMRIQCRGSRFVEIPLAYLISNIDLAIEKPAENAIIEEGNKDNNGSTITNESE